MSATRRWELGDDAGRIAVSGPPMAPGEYGVAVREDRVTEVDILKGIVAACEYTLPDTFAHNGGAICGLSELVEDILAAVLGSGGV